MSGLVALYFSGGANRKEPSGGFAYGMPRYSTTWARLEAAWPVTGPLRVCTVSCRGVEVSLQSVGRAVTESRHKECKTKETIELFMLSARTRVENIHVQYLQNSGVSHVAMACRRMG